MTDTLKAALAAWDTAKTGGAAVVSDAMLDALAAHFMPQDTPEASVYFKASRTEPNPLQIGLQDRYLLRLSETGRQHLEAILSQMISANVITDDGAYGVQFNATPYFAQASLKALSELQACGWGGDYPADDVAWFFDGKNGGITALLCYDQERKVGFECRVNETEALAWLSEHRPDITKAFAEAAADQKKTTASAMRPTP